MSDGDWTRCKEHEDKAMEAGRARQTADDVSSWRRRVPKGWE